MKSAVTEIPFASAQEALAHFSRRLSLETDCWDVNDAVTSGRMDFVLVDVRSSKAFAKGHLPMAVNIPHRTMTEEQMAQYPQGTAFVVYCAGPHCNGANKAAARLASLGRPVKEMIGGMTGWIDEGFPLVTDTRTSSE